MIMPRIPFSCPETGAVLTAGPKGLLRADGRLYPWLQGCAEVPDFLSPADAGEGQRASLAMYDTAAATAMYRNFLDWLFATCQQDEAAFRRDLASRLRLLPGQAALVTGCGLGDDVPAILDMLGHAGEVHAQDLSAAMVASADVLWRRELPARRGQLTLSVGDAAHLPYADGAFDAAYHFGGINLYDDIGLGIAEMARVVRPGGRVVLGDEGLAPWLHGTDFAAMVIGNNPLWGRPAPIGLLPAAARDVSLCWVLANCFWVIEFTVGEGLPALDPHVPHQGRRGGTMFTRHHGALEAVTPQTRAQVSQAAAAAGLSLHDWLEQALAERLRKP